MVRHNPKKRLVSTKKVPPRQYIFRIHRIDGKPLLEPLLPHETIHLEQGVEFITGTLKTSPFRPEVVDDLGPDGNRRIDVE